MAAPTILVAGLGRCGTSLVMQMLETAGVPCVGRYPDFEVEDLAFALPHDLSRWAAACEGRAVKAIDPHRLTPPAGLAYRAIWLSRDIEQQALSQLKMAGAPADRRGRRAMAQRLRRDEGLARRALRGCGVADSALLDLQFEELLSDPRGVAERLAQVVGLDPFDVGLIDRMAGRVISRPATCFPGFLETALLGDLTRERIARGVDRFITPEAIARARAVFA